MTMLLIISEIRRWSDWIFHKPYFAVLPINFLNHEVILVKFRILDERAIDPYADLSVQLSHFLFSFLPPLLFPPSFL
jgi:hypothetical protein